MEPIPNTIKLDPANFGRAAELNVVLLAGGVGGARLADGLAQLLPAGRLSVIVNTGDDFRHLGLLICPDLDTVLYTLAGEANPAAGWGRTDESWRVLGEVGRLGGPTWFRLGDTDLAIHLARTHWLAEGYSLTEATGCLARAMGVETPLLPMTNEPAPTVIQTDEGELPFQTWFVGRGWQPAVRAVLLPDDVRATPQALAALEQADLVILAPSNPFVSLDPILNAYPIRAAVADLPKLVVGVSPIIAGRAVKGPAAKMMAELGMEVSAAAVADYYADLIDVFVYDRQDAPPAGREGLLGLPAEALMPDRPARRRLAAEILTFCGELLQ
ncbi:MAG: 2-phospho-L-lactate transferase [Candidatus Promineifilaceae bacterium]